MARSKQSDLSLMELYKQIKKQHGDAILLCRVGDFYEAFLKTQNSSHASLRSH